MPTRRTHPVADREVFALRTDLFHVFVEFTEGTIFDVKPLRVSAIEHAERPHRFL